MVAMVHGPGMNATEQLPGARERLADTVPMLGCLGYLTLGAIWIWFSDLVGAALFRSAEQLTHFQTFKGIAFVALSALAVYLLLRFTCLVLDRRALGEPPLQAGQHPPCGLVERSPDRIVVHEGGRARRGLELAKPESQPLIDQRTGELEAANKALEAFTYSVAHDLCAPVAHARDFAAALEAAVAKGDASKASHYAKRIAVNCKLMHEMIESLLKLSRAKKAEFDRQMVDCDLLVQEVIDELDVPAMSRIDTGPLGEVPGDSATLRQVWTNLISNAVKFSARSAQPCVRITAAANGSQKVFSVADNGVGFDPACAGRLFNVFERLPTAQGFQGTGIGLSVVSSIVERHGGRLWATGEPGRGATFFFALPLRTEVDGAVANPLRA